ncbi:MAG: hypothetical protein HPY52_16870 [Firmicutes bacterium]|nr:hypothetical protein [Bacillota bacterium]
MKRFTLPLPIPPEFKVNLEPGAQAYRYGPCLVIVGKSEDGWHMSISHPDRYPTWDEIRDARYQFMPHDITVAMLLPPPEEYINIHENCFHLWQIEDPRKRLVIAR